MIPLEMKSSVLIYTESSRSFGTRHTTYIVDAYLLVVFEPEIVHSRYECSSRLSHHDILKQINMEIQPLEGGYT